MTTYNRLISEATDRTGIPDIAVDVDIIVPMAEAQLNRRLRTGDMESEVTLSTDADGNAALPDDFLMMRSVMRANCPIPHRPLQQILQGPTHGYTVTGGRFKVSQGEGDYDLVYYAALPSLTTAGTNWLLTSNFECYLAAVMAQALSRAQRVEEAAGARAYMAELVAEINAQDASERFKGMTMRTAGATP
jgi:hypothetical protein